MPLPSSWPALRAVLRFYLRTPRARLGELIRHGTPSATWDVRLGPVEVAGRRLVLRSPALGDAEVWRAVRIRERERIEPWWLSSPLGWEERHVEAEWVSSFLEARRAGRAGRALPLVVECDGRLVGQCGLEWIAQPTRTAELGLWMDSEVAGRGVSAVAVAMLIDYAITGLGLVRLTAPIASGNLAASLGAQRVGMVLEGTMSGFLDVGGARRDHELWAMTPRQVPSGGLTAAMLEVAARPRSPRVDLTRNGEPAGSGRRPECVVGQAAPGRDYDHGYTHP